MTTRSSQCDVDSMTNAPVQSGSSVRVFGILLTYQRQALFTEMLRQI